LTKCYMVCSVNQLSKFIDMNIQKTVLTIGAGIFFAAGLLANAAETPVSASLSILKSVPSAELPGRAAALVAAADVKSQIQTTVDVVKAAIGLNPAAASAIVGSIASSTPDMAAVAAATAAGLLPKQAEAFAQVAAAAAPKQAGKIVEAVARVVPLDYQSVAQAVAEAVPGAAKEILAGIAAALPSLKDTINTMLASYKDTAPSVNRVLAQLPKFVTTTSSDGITVVANTLNPTQVGNDPGTGSSVGGTTVFSGPTPPPAAIVALPAAAVGVVQTGNRYTSGGVDEGNPVVVGSHGH